jgi:TP901 family phage tail tape measure protein
MTAAELRLKAVFSAYDRISGPMRRMEARSRVMARVMRAGLSSVTSATGALIGGLRRVRNTAMLAAAAFGLIAKKVVGTGVDYEQAITDVGAVMRKTRKEIQPLDLLAQRLGKTTKFTAVEAAQGMQILARAGFTVEQNMAAIPGILAASAAAGEDLPVIADNVISVLKGMRMLPAQAGEVADVLTVASTKTNSTISSLAESMRNVAPVASQLGIKMRDAVAAVALLQDVGLDASQAGTATATMLTKLSKLTPGVAAKLKQMGVAFQDSHGTALPLVKILEGLAVAAEKTGGNMKQVALFADLVGLRGQRAALNLQDLGKRGKFAELLAELQSVNGAAEDVANKRMDTTQGAITLLTSAVDGLKVKLFEAEGGPLRKIVEGMTKWVGANEALIVQKVSEWVKKFKDNLPEIWKWTKRIAKAVAVLYAIHIAASIASAAVAVFQGVMALCSGALYVFEGAVKLVRIALASETLAVWASSIAAGAKTAAIWLLNAALWVGRIATTGFSLATIGSTIASWAHTAAAAARTAAQWLLNIAIKAGRAIVLLFTGATVGATTASWANTAAERARAIATGLSSAASKVAAFATSAYAVATGQATAATTLFNTAAGRLALTLGSIAAAVGSIMLAYDQYKKLKKELGGDVWQFAKDVASGKGVKAAVDRQMDAKAKAEAKARAAQRKVKQATGKLKPGGMPGLEPGTRETQQAMLALQAMLAGGGIQVPRPMVAQRGEGAGYGVRMPETTGYGSKQARELMESMAAAGGFHSKEAKVEVKIKLAEGLEGEVSKKPKPGTGTGTRVVVQPSGTF